MIENNKGYESHAHKKDCSHTLSSSGRGSQLQRELQFEM